MRYVPTDIITGFYADETKPWTQQDICNWLPCVAEQKGTRTQVMAKTPPGLSPLAEFSNADTPCRGLYVAENRCFVVVGNELNQLLPNGVINLLGTIPGFTRVRAAHNQITNGNQVLFVNGSQGFVWNTATSTFTQITDAGYPGAIDTVFIDGYLVQIEPGRRFAFHSDLADALSYNTLDRFTSEVSPDLLNGMAVSNNELVLFSLSTTEFFENTGAAQQPFRSKRISFNKGCAGRYTVAVVDNTVHWLGNDGMFYRLNGYSPQRISNRAIEATIRDLNWAQAFAFIWETEGHSVVYWTFPDGQTFGYDAAQPPGLQWHRRASFGLDRWRVHGTAYWQDRWIASDFQHGHVWELDWLYPLEGSANIVAELVSPVIHDNQNRVLMPYAEILMDTGQPDVPVRTFPPYVAPPIITGTLPEGEVGEAYVGQLTASLGTPPYENWQIIAGTLPPGVTLSESGLLNQFGDFTGTPT